ncbi:cytochrome P450 [Cladochytrium replicatum]|nr:cytochrome P450 [Cladochytrium replicatum]
MATLILASSFVIAVLVVLVTSYVRQRFHPANGPLQLPIIGHLYIFSDLNLHILFTKLAEKYGDIVSLRFLGRTWTIISDLEVARKTTVGRRSNIYSSRVPVEFIEDNLNMNGESGVLFSPDWKIRRKAIQPLLSPTAVKEFNDVLITELEKFVAALKEKANGVPFDPQILVKTFPLSLFSTIIFGSSREFNDSSFLELLDWIKNLNDASPTGNLQSVVNFVKYLPLPAWKIMKQWVPRRDMWIREELASLRARMEGVDAEDARKARNSFMGRLITDNPEWLNEDSLFMMTNDLVFAASDTTSTSVIFVFCFMANYPDSLKRIQKEIESNVPRGRLPSMEDESSLVYTNAVINEILRLRPAVPIGAPHSSTEDDLLDGVLIPKDTHVWYNIWRINRHPNYWSEPVDGFDPDRYLRFAERQKNASDGGVAELKDNPANLVHFGFGRRVCPGQYLARNELFLAITHIAYHFDIEKPDGVERVKDSGVLGTTLVPDSFEIVLKLRRSV